MLISPSQIEPSLYDVAPTMLENLRLGRYRGDDVSVAMSDFTAGDQERIRAIYAILRQLRADLGGREELVSSLLTTFLREGRHEELAGIAQAFGAESFNRYPSNPLAKAIHDLRGGGLTPLVGLLDLAAHRGIHQETAGALFYLTRDHLKIMRNVLLGLDDREREADLRPHAHGTDLIVEKWHEALLHEEGRDIRLRVDCREVTTIGACCMEFGALDRILYNLINNACRHTDGDLVELVIFPVPDRHGADLRFVLLNQLSDQDRERLSTVDLANLFCENVSTTGSGFGLAIVSEFVGHAYGLASCGDAVRRGYVGARLLGPSFAAWFHWPKVIQG